MPEELLDSTSSQGMNPRLRSTRRVRTVPYECCGGLCSFLNSGCFTMCCGHPKVRRRSSTQGKKKRDNIPLEPKKEEISESSKKIIKPNDDDGITGAEQKLFLESDSHKLDENKEIPGKDLYISKEDIEVEGSGLEKITDEEENNVLPLNEENISSITDDISITGSDVSGKKKQEKKNIKSLLRLGRKKKNHDGVSLTSSTASFEKSDKLEETNTSKDNQLKGFIASHDIESPSAEPQLELLILHKHSDIVPTEEVSEQKNEEKSLVQEIVSTSLDTPDVGPATSATKKRNGIKMMSIFQSIRRKSKGKKTSDDKSERLENEAQNIAKSTDEISSPEIEMIQTEKFIPLGVSAPTTKISTISAEEERKDESLEVDQSTIENHKKKFFWRSSVRKVKPEESSEGQISAPIDDTEVLNNDLNENESPKKTLFEKVGSLKRSAKPSTLKEESINKGATDVEPPTIIDNEVPLDKDAADVKEDETKVSTVENQETNDEKNENKKKTLLETLRLSKSDKTEKKHQETKCTPSIFSACTNPNIKSDHERKHSSDSAEVKTIASYEGEPGDREVTPIRIIRNDFFPDEVFDKTKKSNYAAQEDNIEKTEEERCEEIEKDNVHLPESQENIENLESIQQTEGEITVGQDSPIFEKKYGIINTDDFSESLHTLVDGENPDYVLLGPSTVIEGISKDDVCGKVQKENEQKLEDNSLPAGTFRTSCSLSIEEPTKNTGDESSSDTLIESVNLRNIEKSTDTLTEANKETRTPEWVEITNIEDIDDSKFNYIYKTTLKNVQNSEEVAGKQEAEGGNLDDINSVEKLENSCEKCGKTKEDTIKEGSDKNQQTTKCICTTMTRVRRSISQLEEGNVKSKIAILAQSEHPIILPFKKDDIIISEAHSSPTLGYIKSGSKSATPSPIAAKSRSGTLSSTNSEWQAAEEDIDRLMVIQGRSSLSSLGLRSDSMASVYSGAGEGRYGTVAVRGQVEFGLQYNYKAGALEIHVKQCKDLAAVDFKRNRSDPYVKVYLLPDKSKGGKRKTKVKKHTLNPVFDETLKFHISLNGLETRTLWLTVWHSDMFGRNDFLGEVMMALENKVFDDPTPKLYNLQERTEPFDDTISFKGDIIVCLKFVPPDMTVQKKGKRSRGALQVLVKEAKYLTAYKANGASDPFCKSYLLPDKGRHSKQKTHVVKKTVNPVWNHTFVYEDVTLQELAERCLELTVWDHDRIASNEFLGGVRFSLGSGKHYGKSVEWMDSTGKEMTLWKSMLERPNFWVEGCLSLRPTLDARTS